MKKLKQISYLSAIIIVVGSTIGAGIFFKNKELFSQAQGNLWLVISAWLVAGIGMIALGLAIVEMVSASRTNRGTLEWFKNFLPSWIAKSSKNYVQILFIPVTLFTMPLYVVSSFQDAGMEASGWVVWTMALAIFFWIAGISLVSLKASEKLQWVLTAIKFIPIISLIIVAMVHAGEVGSITHKSTSIVGTKNGLLGITPAIVIVGGIPAIAFAFDGFYEVSSLRNDMKNPRRLGAVITLAVSIILSAYLILTVAFALGSKSGGPDGIPVSSSFLKAINVLIGFGVVGIVNGYMLGSIEQNSSLFEEGESPIMTWMNNLLKKMGIEVKDTKILAWIYIMVSTIIFFLVFGPIGIYGWHEDSYSYGKTVGEIQAGRLYTFCDILVNYTSSLMFALIAFAVLGTLVNRITKKIKVEKKAYFIPSAILGSLIIISGVLFQFIQGVVDATGFNGATTGDAIIELIVFIVIIAISIVAGVIEDYKWNEDDHKLLKDNTEMASDVELDTSQKMNLEGAA